MYNVFISPLKQLQALYNDITGIFLFTLFLKPVTAPDVIAITKSPLEAYFPIIVLLPYPGNANRAVALFNIFLI